MIVITKIVFKICQYCPHNAKLQVPENCPFVLTSPRSLQACQLAGIKVRFCQHKDHHHHHHYHYHHHHHHWPCLHNNQDDDQYDHHKPVIEKERLGSRLQFDPFSVSHPTQDDANRHRALCRKVNLMTAAIILANIVNICAIKMRNFS